MIVAFVAGGVIAALVVAAMNKAPQAKRREEMQREMERETDVMKKNKMLEVKEKFIQLKAELEKQVAARNSKIQSVETKLKQHELRRT